MFPLHVAISPVWRWICLGAALATAGCGFQGGLRTAPAPQDATSSSAGVAAPAAEDAFDAWIAAQMAAKRIPGLSVVVIQNGSIVRAGHYGLADVELNVPVNEDTSFQIASVSKAFTAAAFMLLVEEGRIGLDDLVTSHLDGLPQTWNQITLRQLLNNTSGLPNDWDLNPSDSIHPDAWTPHSSDYFLRNTTDEDFLRVLADEPLLFPPGERYSYAAGTFVVGRVIEKVSGIPYAEFMRTRIFEPLGMTQTMINEPSRIVPHRASGYRLHRGELMNGYLISPAAQARGDVGVRSTALDLAKWAAAMRDTRLLTRASLDLISTPARLNNGSTYPYGLGWDLGVTRGSRTISHGGTFRTGFSSLIRRYVDADLTVIVLANLWLAFSDGDIALEIAGFHDPAFRPISTIPPRPDPDPDRTRSLRAVIGLVGNRTVDPALMAEDFPIGAYTPTRWQERDAGLSSFSFVDCHPSPANSAVAGSSPVAEACFYSFSDSHGSGYLVFALGPDGRVVEMYAEELRPHDE